MKEESEAIMASLILSWIQVCFFFKFRDFNNILVRGYLLEEGVEFNHYGC